MKPQTHKLVQQRTMIAITILLNFHPTPPHQKNKTIPQESGTTTFQTQENKQLPYSQFECQQRPHFQHDLKLLAKPTI